MSSRVVWFVAVAAILTDCRLLPAQVLPSTGGPAMRSAAPPDRFGFGDPTSTPARRDSPVETLEGLTGERATEPGREREGEVGERERDEIETDRDSFTPATSTTGRGRLIAETAYSFIDNRGIKETHSLPELILRYGVSDRVELRLGWNYEVGGVGNATTGLDASDEDPNRTRQSLLREYTLAYGAKVRLTDQAGWRPQSALIIQGFTPTGGSTGASTATQLVATYAAGWQFANRWKFDTAMRYGTASEDGDSFHSWAPSAVLKVPLGEKWAAHIEYFGIATTGKERNSTQHYVSPGLHYLVTSDLEVGFRLGWGLNHQSARFFSNVGLGWRF